MPGKRRKREKEKGLCVEGERNRGGFLPLNHNFWCAFFSCPCGSYIWLPNSVYILQKLFASVLWACLHSHPQLANILLQLLANLKQSAAVSLLKPPSWLVAHWLFPMKVVRGGGLNCWPRTSTAVLCSRMRCAGKCWNVAVCFHFVTLTSQLHFPCAVSWLVAGRSSGPCYHLGDMGVAMCGTLYPQPSFFRWCYPAGGTQGLVLIMVMSNWG